MPPTRSSQLLTRTLIRALCATIHLRWPQAISAPEGRNQRIKGTVTSEVLPNIDVREVRWSRDAHRRGQRVERLCAVVGNQGESFKKPRTADVKAPMDFAITIMKSIFPSAIDGNFFKLVHLSNGFRMVEGARPLQVGDVCRGIVSVTNANDGKIVKVQGHVYCDGQPVITVVSTFLYRGRFVDFENTFEIFISNQLKRLVKVGSVDFQQDDSHGNLVLAYLQRHRARNASSYPLASEGYTPHPRRFNALQRTSHQRTLLERIGRLQPYSHQVLLRLRLASLRRSRAAVCGPALQPGAMSRTLLLKATLGVGTSVNFVGMVLPVTSSLLRFVTLDALILTHHVTVAQANTAYAFTGQSAQESGMGMDLYNLSAATRSGMVLTPIYCAVTASIVEIVKDNPSEDHPLWWYQGSSYPHNGNGHDLRYHGQGWQAHPNGLLFAAQFAQTLLVATEGGLTCMKGFVQKDCALAGHSLGEYSALASIADVLAISALVDVVFYCGITVQRAVEHDTQNRSNYAMSVDGKRKSVTYAPSVTLYPDLVTPGGAHGFARPAGAKSMPASRCTSASEHDEMCALPSPALVTASILTKGSSRYQDDEAAAARYAYNAGMLLDEHLDPPQRVLLTPRPSLLPSDIVTHTHFDSRLFYTACRDAVVLPPSPH
ncbi:hypothetical protein HGRIS_001571 [Hohenbuehelia grisea]|uniref:Malonyl-CoA:ACP transacylase (MAT) domain-containing protein n=1 Tax=Hohenbuehelia grisea TaxID=104357 RepID=A0ABR3JPP4_9AGAR